MDFLRWEGRYLDGDTDPLFLAAELAPGARDPAPGWPVKGHHSNFGRHTDGTVGSRESVGFHSLRMKNTRKENNQIPLNLWL